MKLLITFYAILNRKLKNMNIIVTFMLSCSLQYNHQGGVQMKVLSAVKLSETVSELRKKKSMTQEELGTLTGINRVIIGRIEREDFFPSIVQLEALASVLGFDITDIFTENERPQSFIALRSEGINDAEKRGVDTLLQMIFALRQQILLRKKFEHESENKA